MNRGTLAGIYGRVRWPGHYTSHAFSWSMDGEAETPEDTAWEFDSGGVLVPGTGGDGWRTFKEGIRGFSGSFECYQDEVPADFSPDTVAEIELYIDRRTSMCWYGTAILTAIHPSVPIEDMETVSVDFQGSLNLSVGSLETTTTS